MLSYITALFPFLMVLPGAEPGTAGEWTNTILLKQGSLLPNYRVGRS